MFRTLKTITKGTLSSDGDGVKVTRLIGSQELNFLDPFLLLDRFESDNLDVTGAGFPPHPHRGFEAVTYMLNGKMHHKDNQGNEGSIQPGEVQWMRAASGIIHSEMPEYINGKLKGFQLWLNLPAINKQDPPSYQQFVAKDIPVEKTETGREIRVIAGTTMSGTQGVVKNDLTDPIFLDVTIETGKSLEQFIPKSHNAIIMMINGQVEISGTKINKDELGVLSPGSKINLTSNVERTRLLIIAGRRLNEPIARGGPFVMNTREEIQQAFSDYRAGKFGNQTHEISN